MDFNKALAILLDAADVDLDLLISKGVENLKPTDFGVKIANWAKENPAAWQIMIRIFSVASQRLPPGDNLLAGLVRDQLSRVPAELHKAFGASGGRAHEQRSTGPAVQDLSADPAATAWLLMVLERMQWKLIAHVVQLPEAAQQRFLALLKDTDDAGAMKLFIVQRLAEAAMCGTLEHYLERHETLEPEAFWKEFMLDWFASVNRQFRAHYDRLSSQH